MNMSQSCTQLGLYGGVDTGMNMSQSCTQLGLYGGCCCGCCGNTLGVTRYRFVIARCQMYARVCVLKKIYYPITWAAKCHLRSSCLSVSPKDGFCFAWFYRKCVTWCMLIRRWRHHLAAPHIGTHQLIPSPTPPTFFQSFTGIPFTS